MNTTVRLSDLLGAAVSEVPGDAQQGCVERHPSVVFVERMLWIRNHAHRHHWNTGSYAAHTALDEFYTDLLSKVDQFVECYQGVTGQLMDVTPSQEPTAEDMYCIDVYANEAALTLSNLKSISCNNPALENIVQEILAIFYKLQYKLRFLG